MLLLNCSFSILQFFFQVFAPFNFLLLSNTNLYCSSCFQFCLQERSTTTAIVIVRRAITLLEVMQKKPWTNIQNIKNFAVWRAITLWETIGKSEILLKSLNKYRYFLTMTKVSIRTYLGQKWHFRSCI